MSSSVLLVDDDSDVLLSHCRILKAKGLKAGLLVASSEEAAVTLAQKHSPEVAVLDLSLNEKQGVESGLSTLQSLLRNVPFIRVIILTGSGSDELGVRALRMGAASFLHKPANPDHLLALIEDGIMQASLLRNQNQNSIDATQLVLQQNLVGTSLAIQNLREQVAFAALSNQSIMLSGESGVGKSFCARLVHQLSNRSTKPFVRFQPSFCNNDLIASELFGHKKGTFTGAIEDRIGLVEEANGGTLFLDEIDMLPTQTQVSMLGVLQDKCFSRVGDNKTRNSQFRIVVATNAQIDSALEKGTLRQDFYYRCANISVSIPPLRERLEDIPALAEKMLESLRWREHINIYGVDDEVLKLWQSYDWPGNIRQLESVVESAAMRANSRGHSRIELGDYGYQPSAKQVSSSTLAEQCRAFKLQQVNKALAQANHNQSHAAKNLGVDRATLRRIINQVG
jgi:DNA-binding NtrC family response regulator